jgi:hypothetical protein
MNLFADATPWFDPMWAFLPGTLLGVMGGVLGTLAGMLAPQGKAKGLVLGLFWLTFAASAVLLVAGIAAVMTGQPYGVWYGLTLAGGVGVCVVGGLLPLVHRRYREAETRRMEARDLGGA